MDVVETSLLTHNPWVPRRPITVTEYHRMGEAGILHEDDRVELIEGELVAMAPIGSEHVGAVGWLTRALVMAVGDRGMVFVQNPVRLNNRTEPQPDFLVLRPRADDYRKSPATPADVLLLIEVADSSLRYDRSVKRPLYAQARIPEFWIVDLVGGRVEVCRQPGAQDYAEVTVVERGGTLEPALLAGVVISVAALLG